MRAALSFVTSIVTVLALGCGRSSTPPAIEQVGDVAEPLRVFERFLELVNSGALASEEGRGLVGDRMNAEAFGEPVELPFRCNKIVRLDDAHAVARVSVTEPAHALAAGDMYEGSSPLDVPERTTDLYWSLEKTDHWRIVEVNALTQTGLLALLAWSPDLESAPRGVREAKENARLTLKSDRELAEWFDQHGREIDALAEKARRLAASGPTARFTAPSQFDQDKTPGPLAEELRRLAVSSVELNEDGSLDVVLGGITDNAVILRHVADGPLPRISAGDIIWAEPIGSPGSGWYLVRTT